MPNPRRGNTQIKKTANTKSNVGKPLPKKSDSAVKAAQTIKRETATKTTSNNRRTTQSNKRTYSTNSNNNIGRTSGKDYSKGFSNIKTKAKDYTKKVGNTIKREWNIDKVDKKERKVNRVSSNHHGLTNEAKDIQNRALSGALEADNIFDKAFNPMGKFISNAMDSTIDNSLLGAGYTLATGKRMSDDAYYNNPYEEQRHQGISAGAGRMAGMAINYGLGRSAISPALDKATNAVMNGTRLGNAIKGSSILGKIGQSTGNKIAQDIGKGLVKETISDATLGFGQNALINYGEGLRGEDFWKQQAKDTALDFLVGGVMEGAGIGSQIRGIGREARAITNQGVADTLANSTTRKEYLDSLMERVKGFDENRFGERSDIPKIREASENKVKELMDEYAKASRMSNKKYRGYREGEFVIDSTTTKAEMLDEAIRRGFNVDNKTTKAKLKELLTNEGKATEETATEYIRAKRPVKRDFRHKNASSETVTETKEAPQQAVKEQTTKGMPDEGFYNFESKAEPQQAVRTQPSKGIPDDYYYGFEPNRTLQPEEVYAREIQPEPARQPESVRQPEPARQSETTNKKPRKNPDEINFERYKKKVGDNATEEDLKELRGYVERKNWKKAKELVEKINNREPASVTPQVKPAEASPRNSQADDELDATKALYKKLSDEGYIYKQAVDSEQRAVEKGRLVQKAEREKRAKIIKDEVERKFKNISTKEEREKLIKYASEEDWDSFDNLSKELNSRQAKTDKSHKAGNTNPQTPSESQHKTISAGDSKTVGIDNLKGQYPAATKEELEKLYELSEAKDSKGFRNLTDKITERDIKNKIKKSLDATDEEIDRLYKYTVENNEKKYDELADEIRKRSAKETNKVRTERGETAEKRIQEANTEREKLIKEYESKGNREEAKRLKEMGEAQYLVEKYSLDTVIDESTTRALATAYDKESYIKYLDSKITPDLNEARLNKIKAEKRRVQAITDEQFEQYQTGKFNPPDVAETVAERKAVEGYVANRDIRNSVEKAESLRNVGKGQKIKKQKVTAQESFYNELIDKANKATTAKSREDWLDKANEIKNMPYKEWKALDKNKFLGKKSPRRGSINLSEEGLEAVGLKQAWKPLAIEETKAYNGGIKSVQQTMAVIRELARDFDKNGLKQTFVDQFHLKKNAPFTYDFIAEFTGWSKTMSKDAAVLRVKDLLKKAGIKDSRNLSVKQISDLTGVDLKTLYSNLKRSRYRRFVVEPDTFSPAIRIANATGRDSDEIREWINNSKDLYFDDIGNLRIKSGEKPEFKEGYFEKLKAKMANANIESEVSKRVKKEVEDVREIVDDYQKNGYDLTIDTLAEEMELPKKDVEYIVKYTPDLRKDAGGNIRRAIEDEASEYDENLIQYFIDQQESFVDTIDTEAALREVRESGGAKVKPAETTQKVEVPEPRQSAGTANTESNVSKEYPIDDSYTQKELATICRKNGLTYKDAEGHKFSKAKLREILDKNGIKTANFESSKKGLGTKYSDTGNAKPNNQLPQGEKVTVRAEAEVKETGKLPNRVEKDKAQLQEVRDGKRDWETLTLRGKQEYASKDVGVVGAYKMNEKQLNKAIKDVQSGKVRSKFDKITADELIEKQLKKAPDFLARGTKAETVVKGTDIDPDEFLDICEAKGFKVDRESKTAWFVEPEEIKVSKIEPEKPTKTKPTNSANAEELKISESNLSDSDKKWLNSRGKFIDEFLDNELSPFQKTLYNGEKGLSVNSIAQELYNKNAWDMGRDDEELAKIIASKGYPVTKVVDHGRYDYKVKPKNTAADVTTTVADAPVSKTSSYDTTFEGINEGTYTIGGKGALPTANEYARSANKTRRSGVTGVKQKVTGELPKGEKVSAGAKKKDITAKATYKDIIERYKGLNEREVLEEIDSAYKRWKGTDTSKTLESYLNSTEISPETKRILIQQRDNNEAFIKEVLTDKKVVEQAEKNLADDFEGTVAAIKRKINNGEQFTKQDEADLFLAVKRYDEMGEFSKSAELLAMSDSPVRDAARVLAFRRWLYKATPEGRVYSAVSTLKKIAKENGVKLDNLKINNKLLDAIHDAKTEKEIDKALNDFRLDIWNQIPPSFAKKANAWRYLAMLGNPKTHIRNILGNTLFLPARMISDGLAAGLERSLSKRITKLGGDFGTHAILNRANASDRELMRLAKESFKEHVDSLTSASSKYMELQRPLESPVFTGKALDKLARGNSKLLDVEDKFAMGITYRSAYAQYLKAHRVTASSITDEMAKKASKYAENEALKATYRDPNRLASALNKFRKNLRPTSKDSGLVAAGKTAAGFIMDSTVPFVKTPLNILKRGTLEYSPVGIARGLNDIIRAKDSKQLLDGIEYFANGLTGTGVLAVGFYLGNKGIVNGSMGKYDKTVAYDKTLGKQDYAITIGDTSITLDWIAPMSMPFFVGVEAGANTETGGDMWSYIDALSNMTNPVFEMSMLQGIENTFNTAVSEEKGLATIAKNAAFNYASQYVPTLMGQATRAWVNKNRKTTLSTATNPLQKEIEKQLGKIINKTPLSNGLSQDYVDQWGRTEPNDNKLLSTVENFLSPAYISKKNVTPVDTEIKRLYDKLDEENKEKIIPTVNSNAFKQEFDGKEYIMTPAEFTQYKKTVGKAKYNGLDKLFKTTAYKNASDDEKRKMIEKVYDDANLLGKKEYLTKASKEYASAPDFYALDSSQREKYDVTLDISKQNWAKAYNSLVKAYDTVKTNSGETLATEDKAFVLASSGIKTLEQAQSFNKNINEKTWKKAVQQYESGKTVEQMMKEVEARKDMTDSEKEFSRHYQSRADLRYTGSATKDVPRDLYDKFIKESQYVDKNSNDNGTITQAEAKETIERLDSQYGLSNAQKACLWYLAQNDEGWAKKPYGNYKP